MKNIATALVKAQKAFGPALKTSSNPHFKSRYADLAACVEAVIESLNANGIMLMQRNIDCESGVTVETLFVHESGETMSSGPLHVPATKQDAQGYGSALTYARRYSLMAACGIAPEDDDGNAASKPKKLEGVQISPTKETAAATPITSEEASYVMDIGAEMVAAFGSGREMDALKMWRSISDNDIKIHLWNWLQSESKLRLFLKANKE
jgi:ERF superfamily